VTQILSNVPVGAQILLLVNSSSRDTFCHSFSCSLGDTDPVNCSSGDTDPVVG